MHLPMCLTRAIATWIRRSRERRAATNAILAAVDGCSRLDQWDRQRAAPSQARYSEFAVADLPFITRTDAAIAP